MMPIKLPTFRLSFSYFTFLLALYFALIVNVPVYKELHSILIQQGEFKVGFAISLPIFFIAALNLLFNLFTWPWLGKPFFALLLVLSSMVSYASFHYGTLFDYDMMVNIVETDPSEASSYLSLYSVSWTLMMGIIPAILLFAVKPITDGALTRMLLNKLLSMALSIVVIVLIAALYYQDYSSVGRNNSYLKKMLIPTYFVHSASKLVNTRYLTTPQPYRQLGLDAKQSEQALQMAEQKPTLLVLVVGETARSQNYELNGYDRPTNKYTRNLNVISYQDVSACGTSTAISLPCYVFLSASL
ncbi:phosphoethanolamine transferase domain-containing protein [Motilimonas sp. 1_MG-2023]|uniref:phosphoethanolamine transferase n=1 Tax=Motilimonas sp. 1_MG-2023 TaxID=3062672 RepID=UPI0026E23408|nr:phosphoethanolamine transferase domain-containing protein [Motilimonas sp. 1_MG-2023]MDO6527033.1 phosphoethanolamine transferase domain-containing protein [Motilimonas sp. 1_MG-2023]